VLALNDLLQHGHYSRVDHCGVGFLYWTSEPLDQPHPISLLEEPAPRPVEEIFDAGAAARASQNEVCLLGVSGNGGRLRVRFWINEPLDVVLANLRRWFNELRIVNPFTDETHQTAALFPGARFHCATQALCPLRHSTLSAGAAGCAFRKIGAGCCA